MSDSVCSKQLTVLRRVFWIHRRNHGNYPELVIINSLRPGNRDIVYQGDATADGAVEFNNLDYVSRVGWATYAKKVPLWDPSTRQLTDFSSDFSFRIDTRNRTDFGHGLAFFLSAPGIGILPNSAGGFLGLFNRTKIFSSMFPLVHVEFDTFKNDEWDPNDVKSHVGINNNSLSSSNHTSWNVSIHSQDIADARVAYNGTTRNLSVSWTYRVTSDPREKSSLYYILDLSKVLPSFVMIGFSAATGSNIESHRLISWKFNSNLEIKEGEENSEKTGIIVGVSVAGFILLLIGIVAFLFIKRQKQRRRKEAENRNLGSSINEDLERGAGPRRFSYKDLASATNNFSDERKLGEGGFGAVYKGYLNNLDAMVAVKKVSSGSKQGRKEFITEVKIISSLRHRNLVQLIGWCHEKDDFMLVYEFMPNGSLDSHLFGKRAHLAWAIRHKIALGLASSLLYLHEEWEQCVVHRDVKASNIMLDSNFNVKVGDFGLARLMDHELGPQTTGLAGTFGYMAPEYISTGRASKESDVYSFGVVVLEIVCGKKAVDPTRGKNEPAISLVESVWDLYGRGELNSAIDEKLGTDFDQKQAECLMIVGLWCAHPDISSRPSIRQAIQAINFDAPLPVLPPKLPVPAYHHHVSTTSSASLSSASAAASVTFSSAHIGR